jgi:hypothetical protein
MPAPAQWLLRLPEILAELAALDTPVVDRAVIEHVFQLRRRQAITLLHSWGGYQAGRTFLVDRQALIAILERLRAGEVFNFEKRRRERLMEVLEQARRQVVAAGVVIQVPPSASPDRLPTGVRLEPGRLTVEFEHAEDLLGKLYQLVQAAAQDFAAFETATGDRPEPPALPGF